MIKIEKFEEAQSLLQKIVYFIIPDKQNNAGKGIITKIEFEVTSDMPNNRNNQIMAVVRINNGQSGWCIPVSKLFDNLEDCAESAGEDLRLSIIEKFKKS